MLDLYNPISACCIICPWFMINVFPLSFSSRRPKECITFVPRKAQMHSYGWTVFRVAYLMRRGRSFGEDRTDTLWGRSQWRTMLIANGQRFPGVYRGKLDRLPYWWYWTLQCRTSPHFSVFVLKKHVENLRRNPLKTDICWLTHARIVFSTPINPECCPTLVRKGMTCNSSSHTAQILPIAPFSYAGALKKWPITSRCSQKSDL